MRSWRLWRGARPGWAARYPGAWSLLSRLRRRSIVRTLARRVGARLR